MELGCQGEGAAVAPHSWGSSTGPRRVPQCCWAPRRGQWEPDGSGAAGFMRMTELDKQRVRVGGRLPCIPGSRARLAVHPLFHTVGGGLSLHPPCAQPWGFSCSFCGVILYKYIYMGCQHQTRLVREAGWQGPRLGYIYHVSQ